MNRTGIFSIIMIAALTAPAIAAVQTAPDGSRLMLSHAAHAAYLANPDIKSARENLKATQELYPQARANWHPTLSGSTGVTWAHINDDPSGAGDDGTVSKDASISLDQPLYRGGRTQAQEREAKDRIEAAMARLLSTEQDVLSRAMIAGVDIVYSEKTYALQQRNQENYKRLADIIARHAQAGEATDTDTALAETRLERANADIIIAQNNLDDARTTFEQITLMQPQHWQQVSFPNISMPATRGAAMEQARLANPDNSEQQALILAERNRIDVVKGELLPRVVASASYSREWDPQPGTLDETETQQVGVRASIPLYEGGSVRARVRQAANTAARQRMDAHSIFLFIDREVSNTWRDMEAAQQRGAIHTRETAAAEVARHNMEKEVYAGEKNLTDLLQADEDWLSANAAALLAWREEAAAKLKLSALLALLTPQHLGFDNDAYDARLYADAVKNRVFSTSTLVE